MDMKDYQNIDKQLKQKIKHEVQKSIQNITFSEASKRQVLSSLKKSAIIKRLRQNIHLFLEYEVHIPVQATLACLLIAISLLYFMFFPQLKVSAKEIAAAKIHYENSIHAQGGNHD
jgi:hypothetical protein